MGYKVLVPELHVLEAIGEFRDLNNNLVGYNHRSNLYYEGEIVADHKVSPVIKNALEEKDEDNDTYAWLKGRLEYVDENAREDLAARLELPIAGYEDLSEEEVVAILRVSPSAVVQAIKQYEAERGEGRREILEYNAGTREGVTDRLRGEAGSSLQDAAEKDIANIQTRSVDGSVVNVGEGVIDAPARPLGSGEVTSTEAAAAAGSDTSAPAVKSSNNSSDSGKKKSSSSKKND